MKPTEHGIRAEASDYYVCAPTKTATGTFFYPVCAGRFDYDSGYRIERNSFDSYLMMYLVRGGLAVVTPHAAMTATTGDMVLLDCHRRHAYEALEDSTVIWLHFDGAMAGAYYNLIAAKTDGVIAMPQPSTAVARLKTIYEGFHSGPRCSEPVMSRYITDMLTDCALTVGAYEPVAPAVPHKRSSYEPHVSAQ